MARFFTLLLTVAFLASGLAADAHAGLKIGGGLHYLHTIGDIKDSPEFDKSAIGFMGSLEYKNTLVKLEGDLEVIPDYVGSDEIMWQPQAYAMLGGLIYGGVGVGIGYLGEFGWQDPFFALRAGVDIGAGPLDLDVFATYRFQKAGDLEGLGSDDFDSITFGALVHFGLGSN